ncbi:sensor histidine kinase [Chengkuizengella axinellae]|uniref:histidine kinase n=1 Tax=Chengkuizengella axinellae TaxID=3064388 RepID=A0ABT9J4B1_9BACL|nr:HAMP domain-containing sensor histidine kinase [Chengkuizengella sp. 2205SS18-9]MDP5276462.1 HAMP domain-containing sensor histidine kinase [Chengkuizengella sp. 2205SS18-9]
MSKFIYFLKNRGIAFKIFMVTITLLMVSSMLIYAALYFFLPDFYKQYKLDQLEKSLSKLAAEVDGENLDHVFESADKYEKANNAFLSLYFFDLEAGHQNASLDLYDQSIEKNEVEQIIYIQEMGRTSITLTQPLYPIDDTQRAIFVFFPYTVIFVFIISIAGAFFYAKMLSKPLLEINKVAKKMAKLDFSTTSKYNSKDELGELSTSLNQLSARLQQTMEELHHTNDQLKQDIEREKELEAERRDLFAIISHELKSPITIVKGQLEGMLHNIGVYKDRDKYLFRSFKNMEELEGLVKEVLHLSKVDRAGFNPDVTKVNLTELLERICNTLAYFSREKQLEVKIEADDSPIFAQTDKKLLEKALLNIIHNAMMYSPVGAQVQIISNEEDESINITVFNSEVSIDETQMDSIFAPFTRLEKSRNRHTGGSGIGLYIVKRIFDTLGIKYKIENEENGVLFTMKIPK